MNVHLLYPDRDFDPDAALPAQAETVARDLELDTLLAAMAGDDDFLRTISRAVLLAATPASVRMVRYRQQVLRDCLAHPERIRALYATVLDTLDTERRAMRFWAFGHSPTSLLHRGVELLSMLLEQIRTIRNFSKDHAHEFESEGFRTLFDRLDKELDDAYLSVLEAQIETLRFKHGVLIGAQLGPGNKGANYALKELREDDNWLQRLLPLNHADEYTFRIAERDEAGHTALAELRERGIATVADALAQAGDHVLGFFKQMRSELAFYIATMNLHAALSKTGAGLCFPEPVPTEQRRLAATGLYDACLTLSTSQPAVPNDLAADDISMLIVTGANRGGKSTFLRALGIAQIMLQAGLFITAERFSANLCTRIFTHFKQTEDAAMHSGKFEEELLRMSDIVDELAPHALLLLNESFAATNEKEGSEVARQVCTALLERHIKCVFVTHLYSFAHTLHETGCADVLYLRAERLDDGERSFRVLPSAPLDTSFGKDIFERIFIENVDNSTEKVDKTPHTA
ncbi:MutS-related protein [Acidihalobacter ferrooxydans]|uniref:DNA mismatch repair proteins mutS family domain-containing protein n=1 Tax=Acidihalobacter ferrooxydans TaxID=1765967 RepID=A0A1P8UGX3_9GAMM|nr:hypothetical protein [Acidihalobacter ferrooxydans]APZ43088.1 hypothetical protein BW247_08285 [Acidihalobacter ferrooxydans]